MQATHKQHTKKRPHSCSYRNMWKSCRYETHFTFCFCCRCVDCRATVHRAGCLEALGVWRILLTWTHDVSHFVRTQISHQDKRALVVWCMFVAVVPIPCRPLPVMYNNGDVKSHSLCVQYRNRTVILASTCGPCGDWMKMNRLERNALGCSADTTQLLGRRFSVCKGRWLLE